MFNVASNHYRLTATCQLVSEIVLSEEFTTLCEELFVLYQKYGLTNPEQEAFKDAFYSFYSQNETKRIASSL